ncbi:hypothetical protein [Alloalcanivorax sp. C16-1]|uniref:hypothetical protein n=1 Tax=Alloalcanivorax sp. C16-1 TaxID=3390051 RepID=UPI00397070A9
MTLSTIVVVLPGARVSRSGPAFHLGGRPGAAHLDAFCLPFSREPVCSTRRPLSHFFRMRMVCFYLRTPSVIKTGVVIKNRADDIRDGAGGCDILFSMCARK